MQSIFLISSCYYNFTSTKATRTFLVKPPHAHTLYAHWWYNGNIWLQIYMSRKLSWICFSAYWRTRHTLLLQWRLRVWWWCFCSNNLVYNFKKHMVNAKNKKKDNNNSNTFLWKSIPYISNTKGHKQKKSECKKDIKYKSTFFLC